jgi:hypothetical protein
MNTMEVSDASYRDICLLVLGMALGGEKQLVCSSTDESDYPAVLMPLFTSIKSGNTRPFVSWLGERGVSVENGKSIKQSLVEKVVSVRNKALVQQMVMELKLLSKTETPAEFVSAMSEMLKRLQREVV